MVEFAGDGDEWQWLTGEDHGSFAGEDAAADGVRGRDG